MNHIADDIIHRHNTPGFNIISNNIPLVSLDGTDAVDCEFDVRHDELNSSLQHYLHFRNFPDLE